MKALITIPTVQYGKIELEMEVKSQLEAIDAHNTMLKLYKGTVHADESLQTNENW